MAAPLFMSEMTKAAFPGMGQVAFAPPVSHMMQSQFRVPLIAFDISNKKIYRTYVG